MRLLQSTKTLALSNHPTTTMAVDNQSTIRVSQVLMGRHKVNMDRPKGVIRHSRACTINRDHHHQEATTRTTDAMAEEAVVVVCSLVYVPVWHAAAV